jgi:hypothetical protein
MNIRHSIILAVAVATIGVLVASNPSSSAQDQPPKDGIAIVPRWKAGETRIYEMVKSSQQTREGKTKRQASSRSRIEVSVIEAGAKGYLVGWRIQETKVDDPQAARNPMVQQMGDLVKGWKALIELDEEATVTGVRNWQELQARSKKIVELLTSDPKSLGLEPAKVKTLRTQIESMFARKDQVEQFFIREPQVFFLPIGRTYPTEGALEYDSELPNAFGGEPLPGHGKLTLISCDRKTGRASVRWTQTIDSEAARRVMFKTMQAVSEKLALPKPNMERVKTLVNSMAVEDRCEFTVDAENGWVEEMTYTRTTALAQEDATRKEIVTIQRVVPTPSP